MNVMDNVIFQPWIGDKYCKDNRFGLRVLVLGESHNNNDGAETSDFTTRVVESFIQNKIESRRKAFFTKIAKVLLGIETNIWKSYDERTDIWQQIAFYNYIQCYVGGTARIRPTGEMWQAAQEPFLSVLDKLKPDVVLVLGVDLWDHLQPLPKGPEFCKIKHPSTGFSYTKWTPKFVKALNQAKEKLGTNR